MMAAFVSRAIASPSCLPKTAKVHDERMLRCARAKDATRKNRRNEKAVPALVCALALGMLPPAAMHVHVGAAVPCLCRTVYYRGRTENRLTIRTFAPALYAICTQSPTRPAFGESLTYVGGSRDHI